MATKNTGLIAIITEAIANHPQAFAISTTALAAAVSEFMYDHKWLTTLGIGAGTYFSARTLSAIFARAAEIEEAAAAAKTAAANLVLLGAALDRAERKATDLTNSVDQAKALLALGVEHSSHLREEVGEVKLAIGGLGKKVNENEEKAEAFRLLILAAKAEADAEKAALKVVPAPEQAPVEEAPVEEAQAPVVEEKAKKAPKTTTKAAA